MKRIVLLITLLLAVKSYSQNSDLLRLWYLTKVTVDGTDYIPTDYGYYPDLVINYTDSLSLYSFTLADPNHITISDDIKEFFTEPDSFTLYQGWFEMPTAMCYDGPDGPCTTIYGKHAEMYLDIFTPFNYIINQNNGEFTLEIVNTEENHAYYSSVPLSIEDFNTTAVFIYPNPVSGVLFVKSKENISSITVFDIHGKKVKTVSSLSEINLSSLQSGVYFVSVVSESGGVLTKKVVKKG